MVFFATFFAFAVLLNLCPRSCWFSVKKNLHNYVNDASVSQQSTKRTELYWTGIGVVADTAEVVWGIKKSRYRSSSPSFLLWWLSLIDTPYFLFLYGFCRWIKMEEKVLRHCELNVQQLWCAHFHVASSQFLRIQNILKLNIQIKVFDIWTATSYYSYDICSM